VVRDAPLDELRDGYAEVRLTALGVALPRDLPFPGIVEARREGKMAVLTVRGAAPAALEAAGDRLGCRVDVASVPLDDIYRLEIAQRDGSGTAR
jgi:hypothetical protein